MVFAAQLLVFVGVSSCGISVVGVAPLEDDASVVPPSSPDGATGEEVQLPPARCEPDLPAGWSAIAYAASRAVACPVGYATTELVLEPTSTSGACTCGCTISTSDPPSCAKGVLQGLGGNNTCNQATVALQVNGAGCTAFSTATVVNGVSRYTPLPFHRGTCTSSAVKNEAALGSTLVRACVPPASAAGALCAGTAPDGFVSCIVHDDDTDCPEGPYTQKTIVGGSLALTCGGCATCENSATCAASARLRYYNDSQCANEVASRVLNDVCNEIATGQSGASISRFRYDTVMSTPTCAPTSSPTMSVELEQRRTVCCR